MLTDRGTEYCGKVETHDYKLYLAVNDIEHTKSKTRHPQTNVICEGTVQNFSHFWEQLSRTVWVRPAGAALASDTRKVVSRLQGP